MSPNSIRHHTPGDEHLRLKGNRRLTLPLHLSCASPHRHREVSPVATPQPMFGTERLRTGINDTPAARSSTFDTCLWCDTDNVNGDHDTTGLCVSFGGAVDWKSRLLKPTAQSTTKLRNRHMTDAFNGISGRMVIWEELRTWHDLASVFCLLLVWCLLFYGLVFYGRNNGLEECLLSLCRVHHHVVVG